MGYTKLFSEIVTSTVWQEPDHVRLTWITLLALKERNHVANVSIPGLAHAARITVELCEDAIVKLESPDLYSRSKEFEGRRIQRVDGGYLILNGDKYRKKMSLEDRANYQRKWIANKRNKQKLAKTSIVDTKSTMLGHSDSDSDTDTEKMIFSDGENFGSKGRVTFSQDSGFSIPNDILKKWGDTYPLVDVGAEVKAAEAWALAKGGAANPESLLVTFLSNKQSKLEVVPTRGTRKASGPKY
jgi:hypothetical protein